MPEWNECPDCKTLYKGSFEEHKKICRPVPSEDRYVHVEKTPSGPVSYFSSASGGPLPINVESELTAALRRGYPGKVILYGIVVMDPNRVSTTEMLEIQRDVEAAFSKYLYRFKVETQWGRTRAL